MRACVAWAWGRAGGSSCKTTREPHQTVPDGLEQSGWRVRMQTHVKLRNDVFPFTLDLAIFPVRVHGPRDNDKLFWGWPRQRHLIPGKRGRRQRRHKDRLIVGEVWEGVEGLIFLQESHLPGVQQPMGRSVLNWCTAVRTPSHKTTVTLTTNRLYCLGAAPQRSVQCGVVQCGCSRFGSGF